MGTESLPLWIVEAGYEGWSARSGKAATRAGLTHRPLDAHLRDVLTWERDAGIGRARVAGLSAGWERELLAEWGRHRQR